MIAYAITNNSQLNNSLNRADMILYRDKTTTSYSQNAKLFLAEARRENFSKILLHSDYGLAHELGADGVHLTSQQFNDIEDAKALGLFVIVSTHTLKEALNASQKGADMITLSPIFATPNKGEPKGLDFLLEVVKAIEIPIIALGGILTQEQIEACRECGASGFASIRYFTTQ